MKIKEKNKVDKIPLIIMPDELIPCEIATIALEEKTAIFLKLPNGIKFIIYIKEGVYDDLTKEISRVFEKELKK